MGEVYAKSVINTALAQVGKDCGKTNEYSAQLDSVNFYNTKKNGYADSCSIFVDDMVFRNMKNSSNPAHDTRAVLYEPDVDNCGAGCTQAAQYFKNHGKWITKHSDAQSGDKIFFKKSNNVIYHTGLVVDWDSKGFYTVEGNTNGGKVAKKFYPYGDSKIAGFGRPNYTGWEEPKPEPTPTPDPEPTPTPDPKPSKTKSGMVRVNSVLNVRSAPTTNAPVVKQLKDQTIVTIYETKNGWDRIGSNEWANNTWIKEGKEYTVKVNSYLNVRSGPGVMYGVVGKKYNGNKVIVYETKNGFGHIGVNQWVSMTYLK